MNRIPIYLLLYVLILLLSACGSEKNDFIDRMEMEHENDRPVANAASENNPGGEISGQEVTYATVAGDEITGYLARPDAAEGDLPGIIVIHEWWGLNENIRMMTRKLADQGYVALAVDLYSGKVAETSENASTYARSVNQNEAVSNLTQTYEYLTGEQNATDIGTIGWCFGGGWSLQTALAMPDKIDATVIYYGRLVTDKKRLESLQMPILGHFGSEDRGIPVETVNKFESALNDLDKQASIHIYEGANHAFANPSGTRYKKEAADKAWERTLNFFGQHLKK